MNNSTIYLNLDRSVIVTRQNVKVGQLGKVVCSDKELQRKIAQIHVFQIINKSQKIQVVSAMKVIEAIMQEIGECSIENIGETDVVVHLEDALPEEKKQQETWGIKCAEIVKIAVVCLILFFGAAFSIMAFHTDISIQDLFSRLYWQMTGEKSNHFTILEIFYSIGILTGVLVFFNHVGTKKITSDPTPVQVQMREYEKTVDETFIENVSRKGSKIDVE